MTSLEPVLQKNRFSTQQAIGSFKGLDLYFWSKKLTRYEESFFFRTKILATADKTCHVILAAGKSFVYLCHTF